MSPRPFVLAQVGCGYWGPNLLRSFHAVPGARVKWLCDKLTGRLDWAKERYPGLRTTTELNDVLSDPEVDGVVIATEVVTHHAIAKAALLAGKHIFVEKPLAHSVREAIDLAELAVSQHLVVLVGHVYLYNPALRALLAGLTPRRLGRPLYLDLARVNPGPPAPKHSVIWDLAPHEASLAIALIGSRPVSVRATGMRWGLKVFEAAFIEVAFANGARARIHASWRGHARVRRLDAYCEKGAAYFDEMAEEKLRFVFPGRDNRGGKAGSSATLTYGAPRVEVPKLPAAEPLKAECADFVACARRGGKPVSGAALGVAVVRVLQAAESSAASHGKEVKL